MGDKITAVLVTFGVILPLCTICVLGLGGVGTLIAGLAAWLGGFGIWAIVLAAIGSALVIRRLLRRRECNREQT